MSKYSSEITKSALGSQALIEQFVQLTPGLTFSEQAELLSASLEDLGDAWGELGTPPSRAAPRPATRPASPSPSRPPPASARPAARPPAPAARPAPQNRPNSPQQPQQNRPQRPSLDFASIFPYVQQGVDIFRQFVPSPGGGGQPSTPPAPAPGGVIPDMPSPIPVAPPAQDPGASFVPPPADPAATAPATTTSPPGQPPSPPSFAQMGPGSPQLSAMLQALRAGQVPSLAPPAPPAAPRMDATALLRLLFGSPHLQQALQLAAVLGAGAPRTVSLPFPTWGGGQPGLRPMPIPLGAVLNAVQGLAGQAMMELEALSGEGDPEVPQYLIGEDGEPIVDPADPDARADLVTYLFRISAEAERAKSGEDLEDVEDLEDSEDRFARDAGF